MTAGGSVAETLGDDLDDIEFLGRGSSGEVYRATQRSLGRTVAVKVFRRFADDAADAFLAEAQAQAALSWHGSIVSLYDQGVTGDGFPYLVMEYAPGGSLQSRIEDSGPLSEVQWRRVGSQLAAALAAAHDAGVVHCDVKPSNVLFAADGSVRLADFGIARATGTTTGTIDSIEGSLGYVAPELLDGAKPTPASDVYSLALTLGYAQSGKSPLRDGLTIAQGIAAVSAGVPVAELTWAPWAADVQRTLERACSAQVGSRPTAAQMAVTLAPLERSAVGAPAGRGSRTGVRFGIAASVLAIVALVGAVIVTDSRTGTEPVAAEAAAFDLCGEYQEYVDARMDIFGDVSASLEQSTSPVDAATQLLKVYPDRFGKLALAYIQKVLGHSSLQGAVTADQLATMAIADNLRVLGGGKPFLFDGASGSFDPAVLPVYLAQPSRVFSQVNSYSSTRCPDVSGDFGPARARMSSAIFFNLLNPDFMRGFFDDPRSLDVFDVRSTILIATYAWSFFDGILLEEPEWCMALLERHDDVRRVLSLEHPETLLRVVAENPDQLDELKHPEWLDDLQSGLNRAMPMEKIGIARSYGEELRALGLEVR